MVLWVIIFAIMVLAAGGRFYSRYLARSVGEDVSRITPAVEKNDGCDYVPTPTPVVFAHHFASIAGAGPIIGPVIAMIYGWVPALLWVVLGGVAIGAVHDYLATYMATREGGQSVATIARRLLGKDVFIAFTILLIVMLALVCAAFLNLSATALTSMLPFDRLELPRDQSLFRVANTSAGDQVVIGGIASMSVIVITGFAPFLGWLYLKKQVAVWKCSLLAIVICAVSIVVGLLRPVAFPAETHLLGWTLTSQDIWRLLLSGYVLIAAGAPVWIFLQSRDFINVHILYVGMAALLATLIVAGIRGGSSPDPIPAFNMSEGNAAQGFFWPALFIVIACGAVSGFHSLCAGGTTCKQLTSEVDARCIGYYGMLLESFLAVCVICVLMIGANKFNYIGDVYPSLRHLSGTSNPILGFAIAVGNAGKIAFGVPIAVGALSGMILLEGFLVTTLDTAVRLTRYLIEEIWRAFLGQYDVFATPAPQATSEWGAGDTTPVGAAGIPTALATGDPPPTPQPKPTTGLFRQVLMLLRQYWFNSALAVALTLAFALTGGVTALWGIFATSNQLLAAMVLSLASLWLLRQGRRVWFAIIPAVLMLATTGASLVLMLKQFSAGPSRNPTLLVADVVIIIITAYLVLAGVRAVVQRSQHYPETVEAVG
jgi:carbon starvation protein